MRARYLTHSSSVLSLLLVTGGLAFAQAPEDEEGDEVAPAPAEPQKPADAAPSPDDAADAG